MVKRLGVSPFLEGLAKQNMQSVDVQIIDSVRNHLFGPPDRNKKSMLDLAAINIQRGRDHGLPSYNSCREQLGLARKCDFAEITRNKTVQDRLRRAYRDDIDAIDPWLGGLAEDPIGGAAVGEFISCVLIDQFERTRDGDRFWYENDPVLADELKAVGLSIPRLRRCRLSHIIRANTLAKVPENVFKC